MKRGPQIHRIGIALQIIDRGDLLLRKSGARSTRQVVTADRSTPTEFLDSCSRRKSTIAAAEP